MAKPYRNIDVGAAGQVVKNAPTRLLWYYIYNQASSVRFLKIYDTASTPLSTDTPVLTLPIPPNSNGANGDLGFEKLLDGMMFERGLGIRATTGVADADTGAPSANDVIVNLLAG
jgi:hypothetical protein